MELVLIGVGLSMDAFAVALCKGLSMRRINYAHAAVIALFFGVFQAVMPLIGWVLGTQFARHITSVDHWIAFALLAWVGGNMLRSALKPLKDRECSCPATDPAAGRNLWILGVATSLDALAVGLSFALLQTPIWGPAALIGVVCALITACGLYLGKSLARLCALNGWAELLGGLTLLAIACNILREHHVFD